METDNPKHVTLLIPAYNEQEALPRLYERLTTLFDANPGYHWEVLTVNDGSSDNTLLMLRQMRARDERFHYIDLSRNFGKEIAMLAGLDYADGDCVVLLDADLQDPPELIPQMLNYWEEGYDDIYARRLSRGKEPWLRRKLSLAYYRILAKMTQEPVLQNTGDFGLLDRICVDALRSMRETQRYTKGLFTWIGFRKKELTFDRGDRTAGHSKWSLSKLFGLATEGITSATTKPLRIASVAGIVISLIAFVNMIRIIIKTLVYGEPVQGFPTLMVTILFLGGVQLLTIGIIGEYIGRIFNEAKGRPPYFVREHDGHRPTPTRTTTDNKTKQ